VKVSQMIATALAAALTFSAAPLRAGDHLVPSADVRQQLTDREQSRSQKVEQLTEFFQSPAAAQALAKAGMDASKISEAVSSLDNESLESLSARALDAQSDLSAGALNNQQLTYIIIALGTAVLILVIVAA
jgi:flagellar hook-length control protein FliK